MIGLGDNTTPSRRHHLPLLNQNEWYRNWPVRYPLGPLTKGVSGQEMNKKILRIRGHYPLLDKKDGPILDFAERSMRIVNNTLVMPYDPELELRTEVRKYTRELIIPIPSQLYHMDAECAFDLKATHMRKPDPFAHAAHALTQILLGLLQAPNVSKYGFKDYGIGLCYGPGEIPLDNELDGKDVEAEKRRAAAAKRRFEREKENQLKKAAREAERQDKLDKKRQEEEIKKEKKRLQEEEKLAKKKKIEEEKEKKRIEKEEKKKKLEEEKAAKKALLATLPKRGPGRPRKNKQLDDDEFNIDDIVIASNNDDEEEREFGEDIVRVKEHLEDLKEQIAMLKISHLSEIDLTKKLEKSKLIKLKEDEIEELNEKIKEIEKPIQQSSSEEKSNQDDDEEEDEQPIIFTQEADDNPFEEHIIESNTNNNNKRDRDDSIEREDIEEEQDKFKSVLIPGPNIPSIGETINKIAGKELVQQTGEEIDTSKGETIDLDALPPQMHKFGDGLEIGGAYDEPKFFHIRRKNKETGEFIDITEPRYQVSYRYIWSDELNNNEDIEERKWKFSTPDIMLLKIEIIDPRISLARGIYRLLRQNIKRMIAARAKSSVKATVNAQDAAKIDDSEYIAYDAYMSNAYHTLVDLRKFAQICSIMTTRNSKLMHEFDELPITAPFFQNDSLLDPCRLFNVDYLFFSEDQRYQFSMLLSDINAKRDSWTDEQFQTQIIDKWKKNIYFIEFVEKADYERVGIKGQHTILFNNNNDDDDDDDDDDELQNKKLIYVGDPKINPDIDYPKIRNVPTSGYKLFVEPHCLRVVRLDPENVGAIETLSMIFPFRMNVGVVLNDDVPPIAPNIPFPPLNEQVVVKRRAWMQDVIDYISHLTYTNEMDNETPSDSVLRRYFCEPKPTFDSSFFKGKKFRETTTLRLDEVFSAIDNSLHWDNSEHPKAIQSVLRYVHDNPRESIYPDLYTNDTKNDFAFEYHRNLTIYGNYTANFTERYIEGEPCRAFAHHQVFGIVNLCFAQQFRCKLGLQNVLMPWGASSLGKSRYMEFIFAFGIPNTICPKGSQSAQAMSTNDKNHDAAFGYIDELQKTAAILDEKNVGEGVQKTAITASVTSRQVFQHGSRGKRHCVQVLTLCRGVQLWCTNLIWFLLADFIRTRTFPIYIYKDRLFARKLEDVIPRRSTGHEHYEVSRIIRGFQAFSMYLGAYVSGGAIAYNAKRHTKVASLIINRIEKIIDSTYPKMNFMSPRDRIDKIELFLYAVAAHRIWVNICSGVYAEHPYLRPGIGYNVETFKAIQSYGLLTSTEEDAYVVLSYFEDVLPSGQHTVLVDYLLEKVKNQGYLPGMTPAQFRDIQCFRVKTIGPDGVIENYNVAGAQRITDYEYIDTGVCPAGAEINAISNLCEAIADSYPFIHNSAIREALKGLLQETYTFKPVNMNTLNYSPLLNGSGKILLLTSSGGGNGKNLFVLRSWIDQYVDESSIFYRPESPTDARFRASPLELAIIKSTYYGQKKRTILLPGMTLSRPLNRSSPNLRIMPHIFKIVDIPGNDITPKNKETILMIANPDGKSPIKSLAWEGKTSYERQAFGEVLDDNMKEYYYDPRESWTIPILPKDGDNDSIERQKQSKKEIMRIFSPDSVENKWHDLHITEPLRHYPQYNIAEYEKIYDSLNADPDTLPVYKCTEDDI